MATANQKPCTVCPKPGKKLCQGCKNINYCSRECQKRDWKTHKLLCKTFPDFADRPTPDSRRVILFPDNESKPKFIWLTTSLHGACGYYYESLNVRTIIADGHLDFQMIQHNALLNRNLDHTIRLYGRDAYLTDGSVDNRSITSVVRGAPTHPWKGPSVAHGMKGLGVEQVRCDDLDTKDFKMIVDHFLAYRQDDKDLPREDESGEVQGVMVHCLNDVELGKRPFEAVKVPADHAIFSKGQSSHIAKRIGMPLFSALLPPNKAWGGNNDSSRIVFLHMQCDESDMPPTGWGWAAMYWQLNIASALVVRQDKAPLSAKDVEALCSWCADKLQPLFGEVVENEYGCEAGDGVERGLARETVMAQVTKEGFDKHVAAMEGGAYGGFGGAGQNGSV